MNSLKMWFRKSCITVSCWLVSVFVLIGIIGDTAVAGSQNDGTDRDPVDFVDYLKTGELGLNLRYRFEYATDGTTELTGKDARASTLRTSLRYRSRPYHGFAGFVEFENVAVLGEDSFNNRGAGSLSNGITDRPVVADVKLTELNQVYFDLTAIPDTTIHAGREEILLDNQRFLGNVGWRQNHQSFDTVSIVNRTIPRTAVTYVHIFNVNRIFGDSRPASSNLLHAAVRISASDKLVGYAYLLDYDDPGDFALAGNTFGFRLSGNRKVAEDWSLLYDAEYARQDEGSDNPNPVDADYFRLEAGAELEGILNLKAGHESLGGSPGDGQFNTPLATLHAWNGWADKFLSTPENGLRDTYVSLGGNYKNFGLNGVFHWFRSETAGIDYGKETDLLLTYSSPWKQLFAFKAAFYRADGYSEDTDKIMIYTAYGF